MINVRNCVAYDKAENIPREEPSYVLNVFHYHNHLSGRNGCNSDNFRHHHDKIIVGEVVSMNLELKRLPTLRGVGEPAVIGYFSDPTIRAFHSGMSYEQ